MTTWNDALFDELSHQGDERADGVVIEHVATTPPAHPRELVVSIAQHLVLPPEARSAPIHEYLTERPPLPERKDDAKLRHSADFFDQNGLTIGAALFCASLPEAYAASRGARVLTLTARMVNDPVRRVYETAQLLLDVMSAGGLDPATGAGYEDIRRVRLMHAAVRYLILNDPEVPKTDNPAAFPSWCLISASLKAAELVAGMADAPLLRAAVHQSRAQLALHEGDPDLVTKHSGELLDLANASGFRLQVIDALELLAAVAVGDEGPESRSQLLKAARDERDRIGYRFSMLPR